MTANQGSFLRCKAIRSLLVCVLSLFFCAALWHMTAEKGLAQDDDVGVPEEAEPAAEEGVVDATHRKVSQTILASSDWLDKFFDNELYEEEDNRTRLRLKFSSFIESGEGLDNSVKVSLRLTLPRLQERLQLFFIGDGDDEFDLDNTEEENLSLRYADADDEQGTIGAEYFLKRTKRRNISLKAGVRLSSGDTKFYIGPRYRHLFFFGKWSLRFTEQIRYFTEEGFESKTRIDCERRLSKTLFFRFTPNGNWYEEEHGYYYSFRLMLYQILTHRRVLKYEWYNGFETKPHHQLQKVTLRIRYRQRVRREWMYAELMPQLSFPRDRDFKITPGFMVRIEVVLGEVRERAKRGIRSII